MCHESSSDSASSPASSLRGCSTSGSKPTAAKCSEPMTSASSNSAGSPVARAAAIASEVMPVPSAIASEADAAPDLAAVRATSRASMAHVRLTVRPMLSNPDHINARQRRSAGAFRARSSNASITGSSFCTLALRKAYQPRLTPICNASAGSPSPSPQSAARARFGSSVLPRRAHVSRSGPRRPAVSPAVRSMSHLV